jgi:DNA-binding HxlR family transcriptional regulator
MCKPTAVTPTTPPTTARIDPDTLPGRACSAAAALDLVGDRWTMLVVREVFLGHHRFGEIVRGTGAPRDRLTDRLTRLVAAGILERRPYSEHPPRSEYHLTEAGRALLPVLESLRQWGDRWAVQFPPVRAEHGPDGHGRHDVRGEWRCRTCGEPVGRGDFTLVPTGHAEHHGVGEQA